MTISYKNRLEDTFKGTLSRKEWEEKLEVLFNKLAQQPIMSVKLNNIPLPSLDQLKYVLLEMSSLQIMQSVLELEIDS